ACEDHRGESDRRPQARRGALREARPSPPPERSMCFTLSRSSIEAESGRSWRFIRAAPDSALGEDQTQVSEFVCEIAGLLDVSAYSAERRLGNKRAQQLVVALRDIVRPGQQSVYVSEPVTGSDLQISQAAQSLAATLQRPHNRRAYCDHSTASSLRGRDGLHRGNRNLESLFKRQASIDDFVTGR